MGESELRSDPKGEPLPTRPSGPAWKTIVLQRIEQLQDNTTLLSRQPGDALSNLRVDRASERLAMARAATLARRWPGRIRSWWNGSDIEAAWRNIHAAEVLLLQTASEDELSDKLPGVYACARAYLGDQDVRVVQLHSAIGRLIGQTPARPEIQTRPAQAPIPAQGRAPAQGRDHPPSPREETA